MPPTSRSLPVLLALAVVGAAACSNAPGTERDDAPPGRMAFAAAPGAARSADAVTLLTAPDEHFTRGDVTLRYRVIGQGVPMLLVHGYSDKVEMWAGTADSLARDFRVIVPDVRGFGKSSKPDGVAAYGREMSEDLIALLDHLGVGKAHLVGYSMGGALSADIALRHPDRVRTATMVAGAFWSDSATMQRDLAPYVAALERGERLTTFLQYIVPTLSASDAAAVSDQLFAESDSSALVDVLKSMPAIVPDWELAAQTRIPAVAVVGRPDPLHANARLFASRWAGAKLVELPEGDHIAITNAPEVAREVRLIAKGVH